MHGDELEFLGRRLQAVERAFLAGIPRRGERDGRDEGIRLDRTRAVFLHTLLRADDHDEPDVFHEIECGKRPGQHRMAVDADHLLAAVGPEPLARAARQDDGRDLGLPPYFAVSGKRQGERPFRIVGRRIDEHLRMLHGIMHPAWENVRHCDLLLTIMSLRRSAIACDLARRPHGSGRTAAATIPPREQYYHVCAEQGSRPRLA